nr:protocadherin fat 3 [Hymenolepis microstoma]
MESFELLIEVVDGGRRESGKRGSPHQLNWSSINTRNTAQATVQINIQDENDNPPKFIFPKSDSPGRISLTCSEIQHLPRVILQVVANDSDKGQNAELEYSLRFDNETEQLIDKKRQEQNKTAIMSDAPWFEIEPRSGEISLVAVEELLSTCHTEKRGKKELGRFGLIVSASDKGEPRLTATAPVQVRFTTSDLEQADATNLMASNPGSFGFLTTISGTAESGSPSRYEAIISSAEGRSNWMTNDGSIGGREDGSSSFEPSEPHLVDRFAIFSSPAAFWAATICLAVATTILLGLICTFIIMAFRRRGKPGRDGAGQPSSSGLYTTSAVETATTPGSHCLSIDASTLPSGDSKTTLRLTPYTALENSTNKKVRICYSGSPTDASFYDWPQIKYDQSRKVQTMMNHQLQQQNDSSAYQYGRMRALGQEVLLSGFEVYQPLLSIANNTGGVATGTTWIQPGRERISSKGSDKTISENMELMATQEKNNNNMGVENISKSTNSLHLQKFETSFV